MEPPVVFVVIATNLCTDVLQKCVYKVVFIFVVAGCRMKKLLVFFPATSEVINFDALFEK